MITSFLLAILIAVGTGFLWASNTGQRWDLWLLSEFFQIRGPRPAPPDVVIVAIDDESYARLMEMYPDYARRLSPKWPFPRRFEAEALENIVRAEPKAVIIDARFAAEADDPDADARIEAALRAGPTSIWSGKTPQPGSEMDVSDPNPFVTLPSETRFRSAAKMQLDMLMTGTLGVKSQIAFSKEPNAPLYDRVPIARALVELAKLDVAKPGPSDLINFYGPNRAIRRVSLYTLIGPDAGEAIPDLKQKVVLFGFLSATRGRQSGKDSYPVPVSDNLMAGTEIHANTVGNLIDHSWLRRWPEDAEKQILLWASLLIALCGVALPLERGAPLSLLLMSVAAYVNYRAFCSWNTWVYMLLRTRSWRTQTAQTGRVLSTKPISFLVSTTPLPAALIICSTSILWTKPSMPRC